MSDRPRNGVPGRRAHQGLLKTIRPSKEAAEFVALRGLSYDWPALQNAFRPARNGIDHSFINRQVRYSLKMLKLFGKRREDKRTELRQKLINDAERNRERLRRTGWDLHNLVTEYAKYHRARIQSLPPEERPLAARGMVAAYCDSDAELQKLRGINDKLIEHRKATILGKRRQQFIDMMMREAGLKNAPRRPMTRMRFPPSAADPLKDFERFYRKAAFAHQAALAVDPNLAQLPPKERARIVLTDTSLLRPDDGMWHTKRAVPIQNNDTFDPNSDWKE